jgi:hydroxymethylbilane synthase
LRAEIRGEVENAEQLGVQLAEKLLAAGAGEILAEVYGS